MGINLQDTYGKDITDAIVVMRLDQQWYKYRDSQLAEVCEICPFFMLHREFSKISYRDIQSNVSCWCKENLRGRFFLSIEKEIETDKREWIASFEFEDDAFAFKLRWI